MLKGFSREAPPDRRDPRQKELVGSKLRADLASHHGKFGRVSGYRSMRHSPTFSLIDWSKRGRDSLSREPIFEYPFYYLKDRHPCLITFCLEWVRRQEKRNVR